jgi:hypothetical protein
MGQWSTTIIKVFAIRMNKVPWVMVAMTALGVSVAEAETRSPW